MESKIFSHKIFAHWKIFVEMLPNNKNIMLVEIPCEKQLSETFKMFERFSFLPCFQFHFIFNFKMNFFEKKLFFFHTVNILSSYQEYGKLNKMCYSKSFPFFIQFRRHCWVGVFQCSIEKGKKKKQKKIQQKKKMKKKKIFFILLRTKISEKCFSLYWLESVFGHEKRFSVKMIFWWINRNFKKRKKFNLI